MMYNESDGPGNRGKFIRKQSLLDFQRQHWPIEIALK